MEETIQYSFNKPYTFNNIFTDIREYKLIPQSCYNEYDQVINKMYNKQNKKLYLNLHPEEYLSKNQKLLNIEVITTNISSLPYDYIITKKHFNIFNINDNHSKLVVTNQLKNFTITIEADIYYYENNLHVSCELYIITNNLLYTMKTSYEGIAYLKQILELNEEDSKIFDDYLYFIHCINNKDLLSILNNDNKFQNLTNIHLPFSIVYVDDIMLYVYTDITNTGIKPSYIFIGKDENGQFVNVNKNITPYIYNVGKKKIASISLIHQLGIYLDYSVPIDKILRSISYKDKDYIVLQLNYECLIYKFINNNWCLIPNDFNEICLKEYYRSLDIITDRLDNCAQKFPAKLEAYYR